MGTDYYSVWYGNIKLADNMTLGNALLFIEAMFNKFWQEPTGQYTIMKGNGTPVDDAERGEE